MKYASTVDYPLDLSYLGLSNNAGLLYQLSPEELINRAIDNNEGILCNNGALAINTGEFTGRSPKDRYIVKDEVTETAVFWGDVNIQYPKDKFEALYNKVVDYLKSKPIYVRDAFVCADRNHRLDLRIITEQAFQNLFAYNMFMRPGPEDDIKPDWTIIAVPGFKADPATDGTRQHNFSIINFGRKIILIGGTGYTGEIKKGVFSVLNFLLPTNKGVLSMHCSANKGAANDTAVFFGLSGTGKTTLSSDPDRLLIGDDEHGWGEDSIFNFEGGCYAKCAGLNREKEPEIFRAIKYGSLLENVQFYPGTRDVDFDNISVTENTRVSYPLHYVRAADPAVGDIPQNIFFLSADAYGVLPPISKLSAAQAMYYFLSGYTAKVAGTECGVTEPQATFSACFGKAFLPLHPVKYADLLGKKLTQYGVQVWLINTGWTGGAYGRGKRISLKYTRAMISAALSGQLASVDYYEHPTFGLMMPVTCLGVPPEMLNPVKTWASEIEYREASYKLSTLFVRNFSQYQDVAGEDVNQVGKRLETAL